MDLGQTTECCRTLQASRADNLVHDRWECQVELEDLTAESDGHLEGSMAMSAFSSDTSYQRPDPAFVTPTTWYYKDRAQGSSFTNGDWQRPLLRAHACLEPTFVEHGRRELCNGLMHAVLCVQQLWLNACTHSHQSFTGAGQQQQQAEASDSLLAWHRQDLSRQGSRRLCECAAVGTALNNGMTSTRMGCLRVGRQLVMPLMLRLP